MENTKNIPGQQGFEKKQDQQKKDIPVEQLPKKDMPGQQPVKDQPFKSGGSKYDVEKED